MYEHDKIYIDGAWVPSSGTGTIDVFDSTNGEVFGRIPEGNAADAPTHFAFQVKESGMRWGYRFEPDGAGGTNLTEYRDKTRQISLPIRMVQKSGILGRNREGLMVQGMRETLERVKAAAEAT